MHPGDGFRMEPGFANIQPIAAGTLLARDNAGEIRAPEDCMMVMPLSVSPARMARWIGAAPRQRGRSDAWMLTQPRRGAARIGFGRIRP